MSKPLRPVNPWAVCTAAVGRKDRAKYERCVRKVKARCGMKNPSINVAWRGMTYRQRGKAMQFAGISPMRAEGYSTADWIDLSEDIKSALMKTWEMGTVGGTTRRFRSGGTTRRVPVLTNPTDGWAVTHDGETLKQFGPGTQGANAAYAWLHKKQGQSVDWAVQYSGYDIVNVEGGKVVYSAKRQRKPLTNRARKNPVYDVRIQREDGLWSVQVDAKNGREARRKANWQMHRDGMPGGRVVEALQLPGWPAPYPTRGSGGPTEAYFKHGPRGVLHYMSRPRRMAKNGTKGAYPFAAKQEQYRRYDMGQLLYARRDAARAAKAMKGGDVMAENWYMDDFYTISDEIRRRRAGKNPGRAGKVRRSVPLRVRLFLTRNNPDFRTQQPDWLIFWDRFYTKFGIAPEHFEEGIRRLSDADKQTFHEMIGEKFPEKAVHFVISRMQVKGEKKGKKATPKIELGYFRNAAIKVGDPVKVSGKFLRSTGQYTGSIGQAKGVVQSLQDLGGGFVIATVKWDYPDVPAKMNVKNLLHAKAPEYFENRGKLATYYVAEVALLGKRTKRLWLVRSSLADFPSRASYAGRIFKIAARSKEHAVAEAKRLTGA